MKSKKTPEHEAMVAFTAKALKALEGATVIQVYRRQGKAIKPSKETISEQLQRLRNKQKEPNGRNS